MPPCFRPIVLAVSTLVAWSILPCAAATFSGGDVLIAVNSSGGTGNSASSDSSFNTAIGVTNDLVNNKGDVGDATANASGLIITNPVGNLYSFSAVLDTTTPTRALVSRTESSGSPVLAASAAISYQLTFTLDPGESGDLILDMNYSLLEANANGSLSWSLEGPSGDIAAISGDIGTAANTAESLLNQDSSQTAALTEAGTYTLTISASVPAAEFSSTASASVDINSLSLRFNGIPEPATTTLLLLSLAPLLHRRRPYNRIGIRS